MDSGCAKSINLSPNQQKKYFKTADNLAFQDSSYNDENQKLTNNLSDFEDCNYLQAVGEEFNSSRAQPHAAIESDHNSKVSIANGSKEDIRKILNGIIWNEKYLNSEQRSSYLYKLVNLRMELDIRMNEIDQIKQEVCQIRQGIGRALSLLPQDYASRQEGNDTHKEEPKASRFFVILPGLGKESEHS